jgi:hypothetical protein
MEPERSLPCLQEPSIGPCHESHQSSPYHHILYIWWLASIAWWSNTIKSKSGFPRYRLTHNIFIFVAALHVSVLRPSWPSSSACSYTHVCFMIDWQARRRKCCALDGIRGKPIWFDCKIKLRGLSPLAKWPTKRPQLVGKVPTFADRGCRFPTAVFSAF